MARTGPEPPFKHSVGNISVTLDRLSHDDLLARERELDATYQRFRDAGLALDLTRGKPSAAQLALSDGLDAVEGGFVTADGTDTRNYGGLDGLAEARALGAALLGVRPEEVIAGGNSSLTLMYFYLLSAWLYGPAGPGTAWRDGDAVRFLCPVPGYDRHFTILEDLGRLPHAAQAHRWTGRSRPGRRAALRRSG